MLNKKSNPEISVIIPVYNTEKYLDKCISSVLVQTYINFELILINDGSTDSSDIIIDSYIEKDSRIRVFHQKNKGVSSARNTGIKEAQGKYICFIDSDDWVSKSYLEDFDLSKEVDLQMQGIVIYNETKKVQKTIEFSKKNLFSKGNLEEIIEISEKNQLIRSSCTKLFLKSIIKKHQLRFDESILYCEDYIFVLNYIKFISTIYVINENNYFYAQRINNSLSKKYISFENKYQTFEKLLFEQKYYLKSFNGFNKSYFEYINYSNSNYLITMLINLYEKRADLFYQERIVYLKILQRKGNLKIINKSNQFQVLSKILIFTLNNFNVKVADKISFTSIKCLIPLIKLKQYINSAFIE